jgi:predicted benzoate:H+ symporter BenE
MDVLRRAAMAYYRANMDAWVSLRRRLPVIDPWMSAGLAQLAAVVALVCSNHQDAAWIVAAAGLCIPVAQRVIDR